MHVEGIAFCGVRTTMFDEMDWLFGDIMGMQSTKRTDDMLIWQLPDGGLVEVFAQDEPEHLDFCTGPVVGFIVDDVGKSRNELESVGINFLGPMQIVGDRAYGFFRGPDGNVYEITGPILDDGIS